MSLYLHGLGHFHPENEITNQFLTDLDIGTNQQWIEERVGIDARRTVLPLDYIRETRNLDPTQALEAALSVHARDIATDGLSGVQIGEKLRKARIVAITAPAAPGSRSRPARPWWWPRRVLPT